ncbi:hypothetical protein BC936DRAFT_143475 [Jimgerdemannia flammicorona]|uniref:Uncharacterized protein n=2 Tax=Jimgerdemannia flammicorona TaxID=994334 RepID=A0A432ZYU8_9FUNG|nr:hypothetical protein BC936DRAFT_143475 [Jimgerdemannia flammicorona]RUS25656.1 hypothetical protein BC938DRAFT_471833 [Jimgerdemannia flammicorona]
MASHAQPHGYAAPPHQGYPPHPQHAQPGYAQHPPAVHVVVQDSCSDGGHHAIERDFDCCGIVLAILFFPIGILCCFMMSRNKCVKCGRQFG